MHKRHKFKRRLNKMFFHSSGSEVNEINNWMVQGQDYTLDEASLPSLTPIIFCEWPKMYMLSRYLDGRWCLYELSVLAAFPWSFFPISLADDSRIRIDSLVPWKQLKINNTFDIPPNTQHNLLLLNIGFWYRLCRLILLV